MPPPLKNVITSEHEEVLWNSRHLSTDTSIGLIQAVIFYLIKSFGLWQGKDLKLLKTEHVTFSEDEISKFVAIDVKMATGSGKVIKRYDDPSNPRSVYKILKTYKGYLANEGPFLVRPISSIKDYICYSPWPLGINIIEQTVVNLMQESGIGSGFGNVSVCLMAIDILKSFGAGSHCISTWMFRLYPRYKKIFWTETFKECSEINCEDKSEEACLVISHLLDPPYPATTMLVEMRKKQELMKHKTEAIDARRTSVFNSWLSNINSSIDSKEDLELENKKQESQDVKIHNKTKVVLKTGLAKEKAQHKTGKIKKNHNKNSHEHKISTDSSSPSSLSNSSSLPISSNIMVKAEIMTDVDSSESKSSNSDVKIMTVLSIPESAFSAQVDEGECTLNDSSSTYYSSGKTVFDASTSSHNKNTSGLKRKCKCSQSSEICSPPGVKQSKIYKENGEICSTPSVRQSEIFKKNGENSESMPAGRKLSPFDVSHVIKSRAGAEKVDCEVPFCANVKCEPEDEYEKSSEIKCHDTFVKTKAGGNKEVYDDKGKEKDRSDKDKTEVNNDDSSKAGQEFSRGASLENDAQHLNLPTHCVMTSEKWPDVQPILSYKLKHSQYKNKSVAIELNPEVTVSQCECSQFGNRLKADKMITELPPLLSTSSLSQSSSATSSVNASDNILPEKMKDSIEILRKLLHQESKSTEARAVTEDLGSDSQMLCTDVGLNSKSNRQTADAEKSSSPRDTRGNKVNCQNTPQRDSLDRGNSQSESMSRDLCTSRPHSNASIELKHTTSGKELVNLIAARSPEKFSTDNHPPTDIVKFLNAASIQLQNILQVSSLDSVEGCGISQSTSMSANCKQNHSFKDILNVTIQPSRLPTKNTGQDMLQDCRSEFDICGSASIVSHKTSCCHSSRSPSAPSLSEDPEPHNLCVPNKDAFCPLLRSVLEKPKSPPAQSSSFKAALSCPSLKARPVGKRKRFVPVRLKSSLLRQTQLKLDKSKKGFYSRCTSRRKPYLEKPGITSELSHLGYTETCHSSAKCCQSHFSLNPSSASSLLQRESVSLPTNSGIYSYRSNHQENAAYQTLQISQENQRTQVFTMSDLPLDVPGSRCHEDHLGRSTSEICLGDYFPEGTLLPVKELKLLTRQGSGGLEVVLKFEYKLHENDTQDKNVEVPHGQKADNKKTNMDIVDS